MLDKNFEKFVKKTEIYRRQFHETYSEPCTAEECIKTAAREMLIVKLQDSWGEFLSGYLLECASGDATTLNCTPVRLNQCFRKKSTAKRWIVSTAVGRRMPTWHVADYSIKVAKTVGLSNLSNFSAALNASNSPEKTVRKFRNFLVHRCESTQKILYRHLISVRLPAADYRFLYNSKITGGKKLMDDWIDRFQLVAKIASQ